MVGPSAKRTISAGDRPRWHRGSNKGLELSPRTARIMGIVGQTQRRARPIAELHMGMLRHHALDLRQKVGIEHELQQMLGMGFALQLGRSEERSVGTECVSTCRSRWSTDNDKTKNTKYRII